MMNLIISKAKEKKNENSPDYSVSAKAVDEFVYVGSAWKKTDKNGNAFLSLSFSKPYGDKPGYKLVEYKEDSHVSSGDASNLGRPKEETDQAFDDFN